MPDDIPYITALNIGCIVENMLLEATNLGLGSVFLTRFLLTLKDEKQLLASIKIPDQFVPIAAVGIGYPDKQVQSYQVDEVSKRIETDWF